MEDICYVETVLLNTLCITPWKLCFISLQQCFLRITRRHIHRKEAIEPIFIQTYWDDIFLQIQLDKNLEFHVGNSILQNIDGLLERHTVISGIGEDYSGKRIEWKIASTNSENINLWIDALNNIKYCLYYQPLSYESAILAQLAQKMMNSIKICDRWYHFRVYTSCFIGSDAVEWLQKDQNCTLTQALEIGNKMLNLNFFYHVVREHYFCNGYYFYRYNKVMRTYKDLRKISKLCPSKSMSQFETGRTSITTETMSEYCVCDLYPRQSIISSQSTQNLSFLAGEISSRYSITQSEAPTLEISQDNEEENSILHEEQEDESEDENNEYNDGRKEDQNNSIKKLSQQKQNLPPRPPIVTPPRTNLSDIDEFDDWKIGSIDSCGYNHMMESIRNDSS